jgi:hypothetical protein
MVAGCLTMVLAGVVGPLTGSIFRGRKEKKRKKKLGSSECQLFKMII